MYPKFFLLKCAFLILNFQLQAQVGINTDDPQAMLDIAGNLIVRQVEKCNHQDCLDSILVVNNGGFVKSISKDDLYSEKLSYVVAKGNNAPVLVSIDLADNWGKLILDNVVLDANNDYNLGTGIFTAPKNGIYNCYVQIKSSSLLSTGFLGVGVFYKKHTTSIPELLAEETFNNISLLATPVTTPIRHTQIIVEMEAGDEIYFAVKSSMLSLEIMTANHSYFTIHQIK